MSGFCAIIGSHASRIEPAWLSRMIQAMAYRGPDGRSLKVAEGAGFGYCLLDTDAGGPQTGRLREDGNVLVAADCRLDNRDMLTDALGIEPDVGDAEILIAGYRRWGEALASHLLGDFAFIIWDSQTRLLYTARDHFGIKPFYYAKDAGFFVCCSDLAGIFAAGLIARQIREPAIADFLAGIPPAADSTSYGGIWRLPPGHYGVLADGQFRMTQYWALPPPEIIPRKAAAEEFRHLLTQAIAARLRGGPAASMLSGGLDSSSIACLAAGLRAGEQAKLPTFSMVFDATPECNERPFIEAVLAQGGFDGHFLASDNVPPFAALDMLFAEQQDLFLAPNLACTRRLHHEAQAAGVRVLLDGHGGDEVAPTGTGRLFELAAAGKWFTLWRQCTKNVLAYETRPAAIWFFLKKFSLLRVLRRLPGTRALFAAPPGNPGLGILHPDFARRSGVEARIRRQNARDPRSALTEAWFQYQVLQGPMQSYAFEILDRTAAAAGVEARYPFWDKRVVEFCLSLDPAEKLDKGWGRLILRRAMQGVLPPEVQWRTAKFNFLHHLAAAMVGNHAEMIADLLREKPGILADYVDLPRLGTAFDRLRQNPGDPDVVSVQLISRVVLLNFWLKTQRQNEVTAVAGSDLVENGKARAGEPEKTL